MEGITSASTLFGSTRVVLAFLREDLISSLLFLVNKRGTFFAWGIVSFFLFGSFAWSIVCIPSQLFVPPPTFCFPSRFHSLLLLLAPLLPLFFFSPCFPRGVDFLFHRARPFTATHAAPYYPTFRLPCSTGSRMGSLYRPHRGAVSLSRFYS